MSDPNNLGRVITDAKARAAVYGAYVVVAFAAAATTVGFAAGGGLPAWLTIANAVIAFVGSGVAGLAAANVKPTAR